MTAEQYEAWVVSHCEATGATPEAAAALLAEASRRYFGERGATAGELGECTYRLLSGLRVPKFASEHAEAVARELRSLREERAKSLRPAPGDLLPEPKCAACGDSGLVTVPHWRCVEVPFDGPPRLVGYRDRGIAYPTVIEVSVTCDEFGCAAGVRAQQSEEASKTERPRPKFSRYRAQFRGVDVVELLRRHKQDVAARLRLSAGGWDDGWGALIARIKSRVAQSQGEAA